MSRRKKLIVIGGGASGFFCAVNAARLDRNLDVVILEKSTKLLAKVRISGGGRCNVTHASEMVDDMLDAYPRGRNFIRKSLHQFSSQDPATEVQNQNHQNQLPREFLYATRHFRHAYLHESVLAWNLHRVYLLRS